MGPCPTPPVFPRSRLRIAQWFILFFPDRHSAAAGGDLATLKSALVFDDAPHAKARAWFETLPPATRSLYATPEDLVASVTIKNIPLTAAQLSWFHQTDAEHAVVGVLLAAPATPDSASAPVLEPAAPVRHLRLPIKIPTAWRC